MLILFWIIAVVLVAISIFFLLRPLFSDEKSEVELRSTDFIAIYRDKLANLKRQHENDEIDDEQFELARNELELTLANELPDDKNSNDGKRPATITAWTIAISLPVAAAVLYMVFGMPAAFSPQQPFAHNGSAQSVEQMAMTLEKKLEENPDNLQGWLLLGRSYAAMKQHEKSAKAFAQALKLAPENVDVLLDYAEAVAHLQNESLSGEPEILISRALQLQPQSLRARLLKGIVFHQQGNMKEALEIWQPIYADRSISEQEREIIGQMITAAGGKLPEAETSTASGPSITVSISLDEELKSNVKPEDTLFIYARAESGPPMPLAIKRLTASALPVKVTLSDSDSMAPQFNLSSVEKVTVTARISKSGSAIPASGDFLAVSKIISPTENPEITLEINQVLP